MNKRERKNIENLECNHSYEITKMLRRIKVWAFDMIQEIEPQFYTMALNIETG